LHSTGFDDFRYIYDVHDVIQMGELWPTFFTPGSHAAKRRRRRHLNDAATAEKNRSARRRHRSKTPGVPPPKE